MPEVREDLSHVEYARDCLADKLGTTPQVVTGLWADLTDKEVKATSEGKDGLVIRLEPAGRLFSQLVRGTDGKQTHLAPQMLRPTKKNPDPPPITSLELQKVDSTGCAILLDFGEIYLKLAWLTHMSLQFYTPDQWNNCIQTVDKKIRKFRIGLALEFKDYTIAFITSDQVFQPEWLTKTSGVPMKEPQVWEDYSSFLSRMVRWLEPKLLNDRFSSGLACETMRDEQQVWCGVGVYTVSELFFMAGISPLLTEREVFSSPLRIARLCEAFYAYCMESCLKLPELLRPCMKGMVLAPTQSQRLKYQDWLHVYAKDLTVLPRRMGSLLSEYKARLTDLAVQSDIWYCNEIADVFDVFEPMYIISAFSLTEAKRFHLAHLVFGLDLWISLSGQDLELPEDPLTMMYRRLDIKSYATHLKPGHYESLLPPGDRTTGNFCYRRPYAFRGDKQIWSITPNFPQNSRYSRLGPIAHSRIIELDDDERHSLLFKTIVTTKQTAAISPLEYCGHGKVLRSAADCEQLIITPKGDPSITEIQVIRQVQKEFRFKNKLDQKGKAKIALTDKQRRAQEKLINSALQSHRLSLARSASPFFTSVTSSPPPPSLSSEPEPQVPLRDEALPEPPCPIKKRRISADKALALTIPDSLTDEGTQEPQHRTQRSM